MRVSIVGLILLIIVSTALGQGFIHRDGQDIVDADGNNVLLRGVGLGGWLVPEGYMLNTPGRWGPTLINNGIVDLIGEEKAEIYWEEYTKNYVTKADINLIANWGFNSIRLPFHYQRFVRSQAEFDTSGYRIVDDLIEWCRDVGIVIILDMHCAPGGQSDSPSISDSDGTARLWGADPYYRNQTVQIWQQIAERYADETVIAGYDLINEPVLPSGFTNSDLRDFYIRVTDSIRQVDNNHLIFVEGNWYATNFDDLTPPWDDNMAYSFHKYWGGTEFSTIIGYYNLRAYNNVPIWMGESGENSNVWFHEVVELLEKYNIGWNWWTHKKFDKITSPLSANLPDNYNVLQTYWDQLEKYWTGEGGEPTGKPSVSLAESVLMEMADNLKLDKCLRRPGVIPALFDRDFGTTSKPYRTLSIPGFVAAVDYDIGDEGVAYHDKVYMNTGDAYDYNRGYMYRNDGVDIERTSDGFAADYNVGFIDDDEWIKYSVNVAETGTYDINIHVASNQSGGEFRLVLDDATGLTGFVSVPNTGGWQNWQVLTVENVQIPAGSHYFKFMVSSGGFNIKGFDFIGGNYTDIKIEGSSQESLNVFPNPSNGKLKLRYTGNRSTQIEITLYNVLGQKVWEWSGQESKLNHSYDWDGFIFKNMNLSSGMYFYQVKTNFSVKKGKIMFLLN